MYEAHSLPKILWSFNLLIACNRTVRLPCIRAFTSHCFYYIHYSLRLQFKGNEFHIDFFERSHSFRLTTKSSWFWAAHPFRALKHLEKHFEEDEYFLLPVIYDFDLLRKKKLLALELEVSGKNISLEQKHSYHSEFIAHNLNRFWQFWGSFGAIN